MKKLKLLLKIAFSLGLLFFVLAQIDLNELTTIISKANPLWLLAAFVLFNLSKILSAIRLNYYFKDAGVYLDELTSLKLYYLGMFYNLFLPGGIGGDGYKVYLLKKHKESSLKDLVQVTLLDRISGLVALLFLAAVLFTFSLYAQLPFMKFLALLTAICIYPLYIWLHKRFFPRYSTYLKETTSLGLGVQLLQLLCAYAIIKALHVSHITEFLTLFLISSLVAVLPITIGGIGAREATFLYGLEIIGIEPSSGVAFSFVFFLITILSSALGIAFINISASLESEKP